MGKDAGSLECCMGEWFFKRTGNLFLNDDVKQVDEDGDIIFSQVVFGVVI